MKEQLLQTPTQIIEGLQEQIKELQERIEITRNCLMRHNFCVVDADREVFAVSKDSEERITFGINPDFYTKEDATELASKLDFYRIDGNRVNLKVMSSRSFYEMKLKAAQDAIETIKKAIA